MTMVHQKRTGGTTTRGNIEHELCAHQRTVRRVRAPSSMRQRGQRIAQRCALHLPRPLVEVVRHVQQPVQLYRSSSIRHLQVVQDRQ